LTAYLDAAAAKARDHRLVGDADDQIEARIAAFEPLAERYTGVAYTPRTATATLRGTSMRTLVLPHVEVSAVSAIAIDGIAFTSGQLAEVTIWTGDGFLERLSAWCGTKVTVTYTHGYATPPPTVLDACTEYVLSMLRARASGVSRNVLSESTEAGTTRYSTPDWNAGRPTGWLEVDRLLNSLENRRTPGIG
jgi:hypothetical protein